MEKVIRILDSFAERTGTVIAPLTLAIMVLTGVVVIARYVFHTGTVPLQESIVYLHGIVFMAGIGYTLKAGAHVRVDVFYSRFSTRTRAVVDLLGTLFFLVPVCAFITWTSIDYVSLSWSMREGSAEAGGLPALYLLKTLIPVMSILLFIQGIAEFLRALAVLAGRRV